MTLAEVRDLLSLAAPIALVLGVAIALFQLRDLRRMRQMEIVMQLFDRFDDDTFQRHFQRLSRWTYRDFADFERRAKAEDWITLYSVAAYFENMGLLYKRKLAPIELLDDIMSGPLTASWRKAAPIWMGYRSKYQQPMLAEWFELLATDMEKRLARIDSRKANGEVPRTRMLEGSAVAARPSRNEAGRTRPVRGRSARRSGGTRWRKK
jgi:hypothetical protein